MSRSGKFDSHGGSRLPVNGFGAHIIPQTAGLKYQHVNAPLAQPAVAVIPAPGALQIITVGGLDKLQAAAIQIAVNEKFTPAECVARAAAVYGECDRFMAAQRAEQAAAAQAAEPESIP